MPLPRYHAAVTLGTAALVVARTRRWRDAIPILVAGVLVDVDHLVDLAVARRRGRAEHVILPLHAWEWVIGLVLRGSRASRGLAGGLALHLAMDQTWNPAIKHPLFYWLVTRLRYRFAAVDPLVHEAIFRAGSRWMSDSPRRWF